jgi:hypothetical protein
LGSGIEDCRLAPPVLARYVYYVSGLFGCIMRVLAAARLEKGKNVRSLSPSSGAPRRIGAIADEERSRPKFD